MFGSSSFTVQLRAFPPQTLTLPLPLTRSPVGAPDGLVKRHTQILKEQRASLGMTLDPGLARTMQR